MLCYGSCCTLNTFVSFSFTLVFDFLNPRTCSLCISSGNPSSSGGGNGTPAIGGTSTNNFKKTVRNDGSFCALFSKSCWLKWRVLKDVYGENICIQTLKKSCACVMIIIPQILSQ